MPPDPNPSLRGGFRRPDPDPYAGLSPFWDSMRQNPRSSARHELDFWQSLCSPPLPSLEIGCGTGRILLNLLERGIDIHGLDLSPPMLDRLQLKAHALGLRPRISLADMRQFQLPDRFASIFFTHRSFHHLLSPEDQLASLSSSFLHLEPTGRVAIECINPLASWLVSHDNRRRKMPDPLLHPSSNTSVLWYQESSYRNDTQILTITDIFEEDDPASGRLLSSHRYTYPLKLVFRHELEHLLARAGFRITARFGHHDRSPLSNDSPSMIFVAEPA